jgi:putative transposase
MGQALFPYPSENMPRTSRAIVGNHCYHFYNRGNNKMRLFHDRTDYIAFQWLLAEAMDEIAVPLLAACIMPNHLHFVVCPRDGDDLARWAHWLFTTHARRYHKRYGTSGRVWQGRFKASLVQGDAHLLVLIRYVERNALRANLVKRAEHWQWGSSNWRERETSPLPLAQSPVPLPSSWLEYVNAPQTPDEVEAIRRAMERQAPFGGEAWRLQMAQELGLEPNIAPRGRPRRAIVTAK